MMKTFKNFENQKVKAPEMLKGGVGIRRRRNSQKERAAYREELRRKEY